MHGKEEQKSVLSMVSYTCICDHGWRTKTAWTNKHGQQGETQLRRYWFLELRKYWLKVKILDNSGSIWLRYKNFMNIQNDLGWTSDNFQKNKGNTQDLF